MNQQTPKRGPVAKNDSLVEQLRDLGRGVSKTIGTACAKINTEFTLKYFFSLPLFFAIGTLDSNCHIFHFNNLPLLFYRLFYNDLPNF